MKKLVFIVSVFVTSQVAAENFVWRLDTLKNSQSQEKSTLSEGAEKKSKYGLIPLSEFQDGSMGSYDSWFSSATSSLAAPKQPRKSFVPIEEAAATIVRSVTEIAPKPAPQPFQLRTISSDKKGFGSLGNEQKIRFYPFKK